MAERGRPKLFKTPEELKARIESYQEYLKDQNKPPTMAGLAYFTGIDRQTLYNYKADDEFFGTIKEFTDWINMNWEELSISSPSSGIIFLLKNYGYTDKVETENVNLNHDMTPEEAERIIKKLGG